MFVEARVVPPSKKGFAQTSVLSTLKMKLRSFGSSNPEPSVYDCEICYIKAPKGVRSFSKCLVLTQLALTFHNTMGSL